MGVTKILEALSPAERGILPFIKDGIELRELTEVSKKKEVEVMRGLQWLENKGAVRIKSSVKDIIELGENGKIYEKSGLPEKRFLGVLKDKMGLEEIKKAAKLNGDEARVCLGLLKSRYAITIMGNEIEPTSEAKSLLKKGFPEERLLEKLPMTIEDLNDGERSVFNRLLKRKGLVRKEEVRLKHVKLTETGRKLIREAEKSKVDLLERLTPKMLKEKSWSGKKFRRYDVEINVPKVFGGRRHFVSQAVEYAKRIWLDLGFKEMTGPIVESSFWVFDALFTPQDHPVREMQDTFFIKDNVHSNLPDKNIVNAVKKSHENGFGTGSKGWQYDWKEADARKNVMRTHTTSLSARTLSRLKKSDWPAKYFALGRCFRNESVDWSHLFEFNQTEGIVIDPEANFRHLLGYLKVFFSKMGFPRARFRPAYFAYTEPSVEIEVLHPTHKKWIELGGAGMFRPEVTKPLLGEEVPVLAWGPGFDRTMMDYYKINDMREIYSNNIKRLREIKIWAKY